MKKQVPVVMALTLVPWLGVMLATAGIAAAFYFIGYIVLVSVAGYSIISAILPGQARPRLFVLSPASGILAISALTAFWVRLGLPLPWALAVWLGLATIGALSLWHDRSLVAKPTVEHGWALAVISALVCLLYFVPGARRDGVKNSDGSFNWMYVDTQYYQSMAASIKNSSGPPKMPGIATGELRYHFAGYAPAAAISRVTGLNLADAYARVTRGTSLWALVLSGYGLGTLLSFRATGESFGGIMSAAGLFFYGSLLSLFAGASNSASPVTRAILFRLPGVDVFGDGGPFSHLILGHSVMNGLIAITAIMGLCLVHREEEPGGAWRTFVCVALPALAVPMDSPAALYCFGVAGILTFWYRLSEPRAWLPVVLLVVLFLGAWKLMGYDQSAEASGAIFKRNFYSQWWMLVIWFTAGLGIRTIGFRWITWPLTNPISALVLATVAGFLSFSLFCGLYWGNERYGIYFLQCMFSIFAFSRLRSGWWHGLARAQLVTDWLNITQKGMLFFAASGIAIGIYCYTTHRHSEIPFFIWKVFLSLLLLGLLAGGSILLRQVRRLATSGSSILLGILLVGFAAWISPWINFGLGRMKLDTTLTPGEVRGLERLKAMSVPGERFATNKHAVHSPMTKPERSYAYGALSERPVLLEGWWLGAETFLPEYPSLRTDNDSLFTTTNPSTLHSIAEKYRIIYLVARPGTDLALSKPRPDWLEEESNCGDLKIYRVK